MLSFTLSLCRQTDRRTTVTQYAPDLSILGHKNKSMNNVSHKILGLYA